MSSYRNDLDPFKDIRVLPREAAQLRHHLSRINHTLQTRYCVAAELSELALQPDKSDEFLSLYKDEIQRVVAKLNRNAKKQYTVTVDPLRLTTGFDFRRAADRKGATGGEAGSDAMLSPGSDAKWTASLVETGKQLAQRQAIDASRQALAAALQSTPAAQQTQGVKAGGGGGGARGAAGAASATASGGASTGAIDSDVRKANKESYLFSTPPEFKGFTGADVSPG